MDFVCWFVSSGGVVLEPYSLASSTGNINAPGGAFIREVILNSISKGKIMQTSYWHWIIVFVIAYFIGVKFPSIGQSALTKVGL